MVPTQSRPIVVLAGWLGCKPKSLNRYVDLYESLGYEVIVEIASPFAIIVSASTSPLDIAVDGRSGHATDGTMIHTAQSVIDQVYQSKCPSLLIHVFSNGGAFLWEAIAFILANDNDETSAKNSVMKERLSGVIFDSAPADFSSSDDLLYDAMEFCSPREKDVVSSYLKSREVRNGRESEVDRLRQRAKDFLTWARDCPDASSDALNVPHLYMCSRDDKLAPFEPLWELICHRRKQLADECTHYLVFDKSLHCQHFRIYPKEYKEKIIMFLSLCLAKVKNTTLISRL